MQTKNRGTHIKICGLRRIADARAAEELHPDFAGFILSPGFRRSISLQEGLVLREILPPDIRTVGVFVNPEISEIMAAAGSGCIDMIQLHGEETDEEIREAASRTGLPVIKAFRIGTMADLETAAASPAQWILLDSGTGTGRAFDWDLLEQFLRLHENQESGTSRMTQEGTCLFPGGHQWILAGGLSAGNVGKAVRRFQPTAVDVSSGVETDGRKDPEKMRAFVEAVRKQRAKTDGTF